jgi:arsenate reductase-like glutaredoxin family protein
MNEEIDNDEILEAELADDALEKTMKKAESEAARILKHSNKLLQELNKAKAIQEDAELQDSEDK